MCLYVFNRYRLLLLGVAALIVTAMLGSPAVRAQGGDREVAFADAEVPFQLSDDAASVPDSLGYHILPANTEAGKNALLNGPVGQVKTQASASVKPLAGLAQPGFFPADLSYFGGLWVKSGSSANIYYNCANQSCWGNPEGFLTDLAASKFIHVVDQYIGSKANNRYPLSLASTVHLSGGSSSLTSTDIESMVHQAVVQVGAGHIFHLFLPQGVNVCVGTDICYSPDNPSTFVFCAYHAAVTFQDLGGAVVAYTVEPYQDVTGCVLAPNANGYPNGALADSTNSALSHELFETITDPFPLSGWVAVNSLPEQGNEIGDVCHGPGNDSRQVIAPSYVLARGHTYQTQLEYSNTRHACVVAP